MGVDIGTMLDVFGRPDMTREQLERAVEETADRSTPSLTISGEEMLLNGPIQGGTHADLRAKSALLMGSAESAGRGFAVHPIGGIVPLMEQQRYQGALRDTSCVQVQPPSRQASTLLRMRTSDAIPHGNRTRCGYVRQCCLRNFR